MTIASYLSAGGAYAIDSAVLDAITVPSAWTRTRGFDEQRFMQGAAGLGDERGSRWRLLSRSQSDATTVGPIIAERFGELVEVAPPITPLAWWAARGDGLPRAVCLEGEGWSWHDTEALAAVGPLVARMPAVPHPWWKTIAERTRVAPPRRVWIVSTTDDQFTTSLQHFVLPILATLVRDADIELVGSQPAPRSVGLVILLTHGDASSGAPVGPGLRETVLAALAECAIVLHLGCFSAGRMQGERYAGLALDIPRELLSSPTDTVSAFALECLAAGAKAYLGHVDATLSDTFRDPSPLVGAVGALLARSSIGYAAQQLQLAGTRYAFSSTQLSGNQATRREAAAQWLRYLDLKGFACVGDPSTCLEWTMEGE
ncbi:MAG TPA: hypothetical protein VGM88_31280 [Kofleriaceae bacterium]|jgi:hypothetical protein